MGDVSGDAPLVVVLGEVVVLAGAVLLGELVLVAVVEVVVDGRVAAGPLAIPSTYDFQVCPVVVS